MKCGGGAALLAPVQGKALLLPSEQDREGIFRGALVPALEDAGQALVDLRLECLLV